MAVDLSLLEALERRLEIKRRQLNWRITTEANRLALPRELAAASLAMELGVPVGRFVDNEGLASIRDARATAAPRATEPTVSVPDKPRPRRSRVPTVSEKRVVFEVAGVDYADVPDIMKGLAEDARRAAGEAYPLLYLFENSMRTFIALILKAEFGDDWWSRVPQEIQTKANENRDRELKEKWHTARGSDPIQYVDLVDLSTIIVSRSLWKHFESLFPRKDWVSNLVHDFNISRRIVAHMNALPGGEIPALRASFRKWILQIKAGAHEIPNASD